MGFFKINNKNETCTKNTETIASDNVIPLTIKSFSQEKTEENAEKKEWIWVEGYKGTDKDMKCRDFQFEIGKEYSLPEDEEPVLCEKGFHLCLKLSDVFKYYDICNNNRFFKVKALVEKTEVEKQTSTSNSILCWSNVSYNLDKLVAKSIVFIEELSIDEIFKDSDIANLPLEYKEFAIENGIKEAQKKFMKDKLTTAYGDKLAYYIVEHEDLKTVALANALADNNDLTLYEKLSLIFKRSVLKF